MRLKFIIISLIYSLEPNHGNKVFISKTTTAAPSAITQERFQESVANLVHDYQLVWLVKIVYMKFPFLFIVFPFHFPFLFHPYVIDRREHNTTVHTWINPKNQLKVISIFIILK